MAVLPAHRGSGARPALASVEEIIDEARNGRMFILVDDEDRENEGDLVIPAQMATPQAINFMATYGRGLVCLAMTKSRVDQLGLPLMSASNGTRHETAFTVSIESRHGVSTGISTADRARTIAAAIDASSGPDAITTPGHVFPLVARDGGVLVRAGHTEAAVDVARLAGLNASGVICEIMRDDGTMARLEDLLTFAATHGLKIGTIRDIIAFRRCHDRMVERLAEIRFESQWGGEWTAVTFRNRATGSETLALVKGCVDPDRPTLVRMHTLSPFEDALGEISERTGLLARSMKLIAEAGGGIVVILNPPIDGIITRIIQSRQKVAGESSNPLGELRDYGIGAQILGELGVHDMVLLTDGHATPVALAGYGLSIVSELPVRGTVDATPQPSDGWSGPAVLRMGVAR